MVSRLKPEESLTEAAKAHRARAKRDPIWHEEFKQKKKVEYKQHKRVHQIRKKLKGKQQREFVIKKLGSRCMSCGEPFNPNLRTSNLQLDHLFYIRSNDIKKETLREVLDLIEKGIDPKKQFSLLCRSCHSIVTYVRKYPQKLNPVFEYMKNKRIIQ